jgi:hypothetical protein
MIGVIADSSERTVISEFFELFKTPWEFYRNDRVYDVLLCAGDAAFKENTAKLILIYASQKLTFDGDERIESACSRSDRMLSYKGARIPIYGDSITFREKVTSVLVDEESGRPAIHRHSTRGGEVARIGYNLFAEVHTLLTVGQPKNNAGIPTLDLHIALLRDLIVASGLPLVEIPPVPDGYGFIACLTHDVDHPAICQHRWDHTMFGFLYRAVLGSLRNFFRGRISVRDLLNNWAAALKLPFVYWGLANDFWNDFADRYLELEKGLCSTFFVISFKNSPGRNSQGQAPSFRAARYGASDIADTIKKIIAAGCEVGLHGIDAWLDSSRGREELEEIRRLTGVSEIGVRMHWLYYDQQSPVALEHAEAVYDSTVGYKETVGYRAGTTQAYKPLQVDRLLELPMHVMDTALFYPDYLGLSVREAGPVIGRMVDSAAEFGGCLTINWHDRSLAPERLWYACYRDLVQDLKNRRPWFATAGQAVSWFRKRRAVVFETESLQAGEVSARIVGKHRDNLPGLRLRVHRPSKSGGVCGSENYVDLAFNNSVDDRVFCGVGA